MSSSSSPTCRSLDSPMVETDQTSDPEIIVQPTDFIMGSCSTASHTTDGPDTGSGLDSLHATTRNTDDDHDDAYLKCVRLLTRQLRESPTKTTMDQDNWNEQYVASSQGIPELLALQNTIVQLQHAFHLLQIEANTAIHDTSVAMQSSQYWKREYHAAKQSIVALEHDNQMLKQQNEALMTDKRKLKAACRKLLTQQHAIQSQQVESYVVSALLTHEQFLNHGTASSSGKNRSRTTTLDTTGTTMGDDFTTVEDDPYHNDNSPNTTFESTTDGRSSPKTPVIDVGDGSTDVTTAKVSSTPPTIVTMKEHSQQHQVTSQQHRGGMNGFGNACHAFGRTFKFIDNHVHKKEPRPVVENPVEPPKCTVTNDTDVLAICVTEVPVSSDSPLPHDRPYNPIRFDVITPTRSEDSNDSFRAYRRRKMRSSPSASVISKPLIDVNALYDGPIDNSNDHMDRSTGIHQQKISDQILLSLPILPHYHGNTIGTSMASSLKSVSPISIPEEDEVDILHSSDAHHASTLRIQCQRYNCDPSLLRSLSIPTIPMQGQPHTTSSTPELKARTLVNT